MSILKENKGKTLKESYDPTDRIFKLLYEHPEI